MNKKDKVIVFRGTDEAIAILDILRRQEPDMPSRGEMIRRLIANAGKDERIAALVKKAMAIKGKPK